MTQPCCAPMRRAGCRVAGVHVIHLNRDIGDDRGGGVVGHEADLGTRPFGMGQGEI